MGKEKRKGKEIEATPAIYIFGYAAVMTSWKSWHNSQWHRRSTKAYQILYQIPYTSHAPCGGCRDCNSCARSIDVNIIHVGRLVDIKLYSKLPSHYV